VSEFAPGRFLDERFQEEMRRTLAGDSIA